MSLQKRKELAEKRLVEQGYKEKDKAIKDYKFRSVSSDFYERVANSITEKIGKQIKKTKKQKQKKNKQKKNKQTGRTG